MSIPPVTTHLFDTQAGTAFAAGATVFDEGDAADCFFVVKSGNLEVRSGGRSMGQVGPGEIVGEMALVSDHGTRSGSAVATEDSELVSVDRQRFEYLVAEHPMFAVTVLRTLARRVQLANGQSL